jgi:5,10-methenyltetrahydrofolate synthetase
VLDPHDLSFMSISDDVGQWRKATRAGLLARRAAVPRALRRQWNLAITGHLLDAFPMLPGATVGCCLPLEGEPDARLAMRRLRRRGATLALAVVAEKKAPLQFLEWRPGIPLGRGLFGLPVPVGTRALVPHALLIPLVGFGAQGYRLGYGGGYFDRTLAALQPQPLKIGMGFEISRIPTIHPQPHDVPMDFVVTEAGVYCSRPASLGPVPDGRDAATRAARLLCERGIAPGMTARRGEYASPPCYAHEIDPYYWDE